MDCTATEQTAWRASGLIRAVSIAEPRTARASSTIELDRQATELGCRPRSPMSARLSAALLGVTLVTSVATEARANDRRADSYVEREADLAVRQPGPHEGLGETTAFPFFEQADGFDLVFRKRALHPGATIGEHVNDKDEIYYVLSGRGELSLNGELRTVVAGDAILTRNGDSHGMRQQGEEDLVIFVVFKRPAR